MFALLGTPDAHKQHIVYPDVGHDLGARRRNVVIRAMLDWLDRYLGPVQ